MEVEGGNNGAVVDQQKMEVEGVQPKSENVQIQNTTTTPTTTEDNKEVEGAGATKPAEDNFQFRTSSIQFNSFISFIP